MSLSGVLGDVVVDEGDDIVSEGSTEDGWKLDFAGAGLGVGVGEH